MYNSRKTREKACNKHFVQWHWYDTYISDSSTHSLNDDSSFCVDESVLETQEETTTASTGSLSAQPGRKATLSRRKVQKPYHISKELQQSLEDSDSGHNPSLSSSISMASHIEHS